MKYSAKPKVDLFATNVNAKCKKYFFRFPEENASEVNAPKSRVPETNHGVNIGKAFLRREVSLKE